MTKFFASENVERLDRFELIAELASGGMATVFLARLGGVAGFQRFVAIKRLHPHLAGDRDFIQMFLDEARLAARLHHPHVVPILEIGESEKGYYLVMEYIEGDTLAHLMARSAQSEKVLPARVAVRTALDALAGLHAAHELVDDEGKPLEIVHRDVSPQNILVGVDGSARITDFGVARAASRLTTTKSGQLKGKLSYMAPEQARGKGIDRRSDVFAMGVVFWELIARRRLFKGDGEADTLNKVMNDPIPNVREVNPEVPEALAAACMKALERDMDLRYPTAAVFAETLEKAAIEANLLGAHRDVAAHLEAVIGTDISQQRDAVRAWLARSEPSRHGDPRLDGPKSVKVPLEHTSVEARRASRVGMEARVSNPDEEETVATPSSGSLPHVPVVGPGVLGDVSSVSSAILSVVGSSGPLPTAPVPAPAPPPVRSHAPLLGALVVLMVLIAGGGILAAKQLKSRDAVATPTSSEGATASIAPPHASATDVAPNGKIEAGATATAATSTASASPSASAQNAPEIHRPRPHGKNGDGSKSEPTGLPDDISHNPYR